MPRYIDADILISYIKEVGLLGDGYSNNERENDVCNMIGDIPTADVVDVVRCKDCKHRDPEDRKCDSFVRFKNPFPTDDDDFCPYGKRKG